MKPNLDFNGELEDDTGRECDQIRERAEREQEIKDNIAAQESRLALRDAANNAAHEAEEATRLLRVAEEQEDEVAAAECALDVRQAVYEMCVRVTHEDGTVDILDHPQFLPAALDNKNLRIPLIDRGYTLMMTPSRKLEFQRSGLKAAIARNKRGNLVKL